MLMATAADINSRQPRFLRQHPSTQGNSSSHRVARAPAAIRGPSLPVSTAAHVADPHIRETRVDEREDVCFGQLLARPVKG